MVQLGAKNLPDIELGDEGNADLVLGTDQMPYYKSASWEAWPRKKDAYIVYTKNWQLSPIGKGIKGNISLSPKAKFVTWFSAEDLFYYSYEIATQKTRQITDNEKVKFYREIHDIPAPPSPNGWAGWSLNDEFMLIYDRYDIWKVDPKGQKTAQKFV